MDFELTNWSADSNVLQLDQQLFSPKNQLTIPDVRQKERKRKVQEEKKDKVTKKRKTADTDSEKSKDTAVKQLTLKTEKRKEKKKKKQENSIKGNIDVDIEGATGTSSVLASEMKTKHDDVNLSQSSAVKKKGHKKPKTMKTVAEEESKSDGTDKINSSSDEVKKKRRKKKKNSNKKNKYKHLDEARRAKALELNKSEHNNVSMETKITQENKSSSVHNNVSSKTKVINQQVDKEKIQHPTANIKKKRKNKLKEKSLTDSNDLKSDFIKSENDLQDVKSRTKKPPAMPTDISKSKNKPFKVSTLQKVLNPSKKIEEELTVSSEKEPAQLPVTVDKKTKGKPVTLREKMIEQLKSARFRFINEQLYKQTGSEAAILFQEDEGAFHCYHEGFQSQVKKWPTNPVDIIIKQIKEGSDKAVIGDFGCGDAKIASSVPNKVYSFDLVALNEHVTVCNIQKVPLPKNVLDMGVFCLSLMGTNLTEYLLEANRILKTGGTLVIAEVTSRIQKISKFIRSIEQMGFEMIKKDTSNAMFIMLQLKKVGSSSEHIPEIQLEPCVYKKR